MNRLTLLTCTGGRPEAFALCEKWMGRQSVDWHEWIVVDDCDPATETTMGQLVVRPEPRWGGHPTLGRNLLAGFERVTGDAVAFIEDDDWYAPDYLESRLTLLREAPLAGEGQARYYHIRRRAWMENFNAAHASLMATACRVECLPKIIEIVENNKTNCYDLIIWRRIEDSVLVLNDRRSVGMKALPGRAGLCAGHSNGMKMTDDPDFEKLREWIGDDVEFYKPFSA